MKEEDYFGFDELEEEINHLESSIDFTDLMFGFLDK